MKRCEWGESWVAMMGEIVVHGGEICQICRLEMEEFDGQAQAFDGYYQWICVKRVVA